MRTTKIAVLGGILTLAGCEGPQSALSDAGRDAEKIVELFWWMACGAAVVWTAVMGSALYAVVARGRRHSVRTANLFIVGGGVVVPTVLLAALLVGGLSLLPGLLDLGPKSTPAIEVSGEQWWWRIRYRTDEGTRIELANEIRLPVGQRTSIAVESPDVVHSFWVPALGGKVDAIPGRTTYIALEPTRAGTFRGVCAEYCGAAHAQMTFDAITMDPAEYEAWLAHQATKAEAPRTAAARRGQQAFVTYGCGACHTVRGLGVDGKVGPDLTHVGSRRRIAGVLRNDEPGFRRWLSQPREHKPQVHMPAFSMLPPDEIAALAAYLEGLQ